MYTNILLNLSILQDQQPQEEEERGGGGGEVQEGAAVQDMIEYKEDDEMHIQANIILL